MFEKGDIVTFKNHKDKHYRKLQFKVTYVNKRNEHIWVRVPNKPYLFWKLNPNDLIKLERYKSE